MREAPTESAYFGEPFLWTALFRRDTYRWFVKSGGGAG